MSVDTPTHDAVLPEIADAYPNVSLAPVKSPENYVPSKGILDMSSLMTGSSIEIDNISFLTNYFKDHSQSFNDAQEAAQQLEKQETNLPAYELRRLPLETFIGILVDAGVMTASLAQSGILARFSPDRLVISEGIEQYRGGFRHIFLGDVGGGLHDIDTLEDAGLAGSEKDTHRTHPTVRGEKTRAKTGEHISVKPDLRTGTAMDVDGDGSTDVVRIRTLDAKSQFPENWSTDKVVTEIVALANLEGELLQDGRTKKHVAVFTENVNGVNVQFEVIVFTDATSGLIENAYTHWGINRTAVK